MREFLHRFFDARPRIRFLALGICLAVVACIVTVPVDSPVHAQNKAVKKAPDKAKKNAKGEAPAEEEGPELEEVDFGAQVALLHEGVTTEVDETPEGQQRLRDLERKAKEIFNKRDTTMIFWRPKANRRSQLINEVLLYNQGIAQAQQTILQTQKVLSKLQRLINDGDDSQGTRNQIRLAENQIIAANNLIGKNQEEIAERAVDINGYNIELKPLEDELMQMWLALNECRKQWLELRQPQQKYAHGNYEGLKRVIDDWLILDALWPDAYCWAALCSYELGKYDEAWTHMEKVAELRKIHNFRKSWPQGDALRGMIAAKLKDLKSKSAGFINVATLSAGKDRRPSWETYFLLGRATYENEKLAPKTKLHFEKALKINPDAACVKYWQGRLLTTTTSSGVRDPQAGTEVLETLWKRSTKQSWRLAHALVVAYDAAGRDDQAELTWRLVEDLAPKTEQEQLQKAREEAAAQAKSKPEAPTAKSKKAKSADNSL